MTCDGHIIVFCKDLLGLAGFMILYRTNFFYGETHSCVLFHISKVQNQSQIILINDRLRQTHVGRRQARDRLSLSKR